MALVERITWKMATPIGLPLLLWGIFSSMGKRNRLLEWWVAGFAVYVLAVPRGHWAHDCYQLPIVFVVVVYMAAGLNRLRSKKILSPALTAFVLAGVFGFSAWQLSAMFHIKDWHWDYVALGKRVQALTEPDANIIFVERRLFEPPPPEFYRHRTEYGEYLYCDPVGFNLSRRHGWSLDEVQASPEFVETLRRRGARYLATIHLDIFERRPELKLALDSLYVPVEVTSKWALYRLASEK